MDSGVLGLAAVTRIDGWNAGPSESGWRLPVDPARLLELLRDMPVARALLTDLQRAASAGRTVELIVSADQQIAEIATGSGHYVLTPAARNVVLAALVGRSALPVSIREVVTQDHAADGTTREPVMATRSPPPGILWEVPSAARQRAPLEAIALPWLGPAAYLEVERDRTGSASGPEPQSEVVCASLHLQLPQLGRFDAHIRVCGNAVAVSIDCPRATAVETELVTLQQRLRAHGLVSAHVGMVPSRSAG
jgi:hypothetical protein